MVKHPPKRRFEIARDGLLRTAEGQESTMYGPLRDLFVEVLGYPPQDVDIDRSGTRGRPDITVFAPGAAQGTKVSWIVLEAKDEHDACKSDAQRKTLFSEKCKYITADTAWFVLVDPTTMVIRPADRGGDASTDIVLDLATITYELFVDSLADLKAEVAGVPRLLARFRAGDEELIAVDKLTGSATGTTDALSEIVARNVFFDGLEETVPIRLMQTHTTCRMLPLAILDTHSTPSGCMRKADRHGRNYPALATRGDIGANGNQVRARAPH